MSTRPGTFPGAWALSGTRTLLNSAKRFVGYDGAERPLPQCLNQELGMLGDWVTYLSDGVISLVTVAISAGLAVVGGLSTDSLSASSSITGATVTSTGAIVSIGNASIGGSATVHSGVTCGVNANVRVQGTGDNQKDATSRFYPFGVGVNTGAAVTTTAGTIGYGQPASSTAYYPILGVDLNDFLQNVQVFSSGASGSLTQYTIMAGSSISGGLSAISSVVNSNATNVTIAVTTPSLTLGTVWLKVQTFAIAAPLDLYQYVTTVTTP